MSDRPCNRCSLDRIRRDAKRDGMKVSVRNSTRSLGMGGVDVYVHAKNVTISKPPTNGEHDRYFRAWFQEVPPSCCC